LSYTEEKLDYNETVHQLFIDFKKTSDLVISEVLYNIPIHLGIPMELVRLIKVCLNESHSKVCICMLVTGSFSIQNCLREGGALLPLLPNSALEYAIIQECQVGLKLNGTHKFWFMLMI
jgi:hypothetical protein